MSAPLIAALTTLKVAHEQNWYWIKYTGGLYGVAILLPNEKEEITTSIKGTSKINIVRVNDSNGDHYLGVVISSSELATVFHRLCLDLMSTCSFSVDPNEVLAIIKRRVLAWQRLFEKGGRNLSPEQCLGLIAELKFLHENWIGISTNAVSGWVGPTGAPQDFKDEMKELFVEVKSHSYESNIVKVSSKEQLESTGSLYLIAYPGCITSEASDGKSLNEYVEEARASIQPHQYTIFDELLLSARYVKDPYYDDIHFKIGEPKAYKVEGDFPRLTGINMSQAIGKVRYEIDLGLASDWACLVSDIS